MIKALFFDIDGTLVPYGSGRIPQDTLNALAEARSRGVKTFISTGRHLSWINNLGDAKFDGFVTVNGGMCIDSDRKSVISKKCINPDDIDRLCGFSRRHPGIPIVVVPAEGDIFISSIDSDVQLVSHELHIPPIEVKSVDHARGRDIVQLMAFGSEKIRTESGLFRDVLLHSTPTSWNPYFCDIIPSDSDKSLGLQTMASHFGFDMSETMAFGDGNNDIGMIRAAATGVAMGNASDEVKKTADYVTTADSDNGISNALRHFGII